MGAPTFKGVGFLSFLDWVGEQYGEEARRDSFSFLDEEELALVREVDPEGWYPIEIADKIFRHLAGTHLPSGREKLEQAFREAGRAIAVDNLSSMYRAVVAMEKPATIFSVLPQLWTSYFRGTEIYVRQKSEPGTVVVQVRGIGGITYLSPLVCGWLEAAYQHIGSSSCRVTEDSWEAGAITSDELILRVEWV